MWQEAGMVRLLALGAAFAMALSAAPAVAQSQALISPEGFVASQWQGVIHNQLEAFRDYDAAGAFSYSSADFHQKFTDPAEFFVTILNAGYAPLVDSRSETFGTYDRVGADMVYQVVKFVGEHNDYYAAVYGLKREPSGWRVYTVVLAKAAGVGV
jgi:uncharacterized protein DUF4864